MNKICTDIEQSKKLIELGIDVNTADMHYWKRTWRENDYAIGVGHSKEWQEGFESKGVKYIPCWSLAALLDVLPDEVGDNHYLTLEKEGKEYCCCYEDCNGNSFKHYFSDNPIDACYEMILKLNERELL